MREKRAVKNIITNVLLQCVLAISGLVLPRLIMHFYGSAVNGMVSAIAQFINYATLIELGIGNASIVALYAPISQNNPDEISSIVSGTKKLYLISGYVYLALVFCIAFAYSLLYTKQLDYGFVFTLVICIGAVNVVDYFSLSKYKVLLTADQKYYVLNIARMIATLLSMLGSIALLVVGKNVIWIKGFAVITHALEALIVYCYVKIHYPFIRFNKKYYRKIKQRWNALIHQLCATIVYNTDIVVLTFCLPDHSLSEISVYSVYLLVLNLISNMAATLTTGINATFGNMYAKKERERMKRIFDIYEFYYFLSLFVLYSSFMALILPFVKCYTSGMYDTDYVRLPLGILFALNGFIAQLKDASGTIINAAGKYKETQRYAMEEAAINICISLILVYKLGIIGVLTGTLISHIWMDWRYMSYMSNYLIIDSGKVSLYRIGRNLILFFLIEMLELYFIVAPVNFFAWILEAVVVVIINVLVIFGINFLTEKDKFLWLKYYLKKEFEKTIKKG